MIASAPRFTMFLVVSAAFLVAVLAIHRATDDRELSVAVLADGFAVLDGSPRDRHVVIVDRDNAHPIRRAVPVIASQARMVGASSNVGIGWRDGSKLRFAPITGDGELGTVTTWGKQVTGLCEGVATNEHRWGIGWLENDRRVWVLHGPTKRPALAEPDVAIAASASAPIEWCRVASAGNALVLVWADPLERTYLDRCTEKRCEPAIQLSTGDSQIVNLVCNTTACVSVARTPRGNAELAWFNIKNGRIKWRTPFAVEDNGQWFSIAAIGEAGFAIGYLSSNGPTIVRVADNKTVTRIWTAAGETEPPQLVWATDRLFVAHRRDDALALDLIPLR